MAHRLMHMLMHDMLYYAASRQCSDHAWPALPSFGYEPAPTVVLTAKSESLDSSDTPPLVYACMAHAVLCQGCKLNDSDPGPAAARRDG